jgi:thiol:disulfide interchange protein DsbD
MEAPAPASPPNPERPNLSMVGGVLLLVAGALLASHPINLLAAVALIVLGIVALFGKYTTRKIWPDSAAGRRIGLLSIGLGISVFFFEWSAKGLPWEPFAPSKVMAARENGKPVIIDFTASWCQPCRILERNVLADSKVMAELNRFTRLKVDCTQTDAAPVQEIMRQYNVEGFPTLVFIDSKGKEDPTLRLLGVEPAEQFLKRLKSIQ